MNTLTKLESASEGSRTKIINILKPLFDQESERAFAAVIRRGGSRQHAENAARKVEREEAGWYADEILKALETGGEDRD